MAGHAPQHALTVRLGCVCKCAWPAAQPIRSPPRSKLEDPPGSGHEIWDRVSPARCKRPLPRIRSVWRTCRQAPGLASLLASRPTEAKLSFRLSISATSKHASGGTTTPWSCQEKLRSISQHQYLKVLQAMRSRNPACRSSFRTDGRTAKGLSP